MELTKNLFNSDIKESVNIMNKEIPLYHIKVYFIYFYLSFNMLSDFLKR